MKRFLAAALAASTAIVPLAAQGAPEDAPSPNQIVEAASAEEWIAIPPEDLLVMTLAPDRDGNPREVVIQLMPAPFSQGWVENIRTLARAQWYDGITVNRVQDNYVVQWGDPNYDNPEAEGEAKPLPDELRVMNESEYSSSQQEIQDAISEREREEAPIAEQKVDLDPKELFAALENLRREYQASSKTEIPIDMQNTASEKFPDGWRERDAYAEYVQFHESWPLGVGGMGDDADFWPVHCYGMVGVGRGYSPDSGSGAELYTVIGHAPRHLDRNIALVGRIIAGMEHLSSLPRGSGALGFYTAEEAEKRTPIRSIRVASDLGKSEQPNFEYLSTESDTFARYAEARANRPDPFFIVPAGGADICNIPVPIRRVSE